MADYIERQAAIDAVKHAWAKGIEPTQYIEEIPAANVREDVQGEWIDKSSGSYGRKQSWCSACGMRSGIGGILSNRHKQFCPNCGARMGGVDK